MNSLLAASLAIVVYNSIIASGSEHSTPIICYLCETNEDDVCGTKFDVNSTEVAQCSCKNVSPCSCAVTSYMRDTHAGRKTVNYLLT